MGRRVRQAMTAVATVVATAFAGGLAGPAEGASIRPSGQPLAEINVAPDLNCQVLRQGAVEYSFFPPGEPEDGDCGTFVTALDPGAGFLAAFGPGGMSFGPSSSVEFTPVSQTTAGDGSPQDPYRIITAVRASDREQGVELAITQTDAYVDGDDGWTTRTIVRNLSWTPMRLLVHRAGDCYHEGSDSGFGYTDASGAVGCRGTSQVLRFVPITQGSSLFAGRYSAMWAQIDRHVPFSNECRNCGTRVDNGAGLSWGPDLVETEDKMVVEHRTRISEIPPEGPFGAASCTDGQDNDLDAAVDGQDPDCAAPPQPSPPAPAPPPPPAPPPVAAQSQPPAAPRQTPPPSRVKLADLPPPVPARTANVEPTNPRRPVYIGIPIRGRASAAGRAAQRRGRRVKGVGGVRFVPITQARTIPVGSFLDTRKGNVRLATARSNSGDVQTGVFFSGVFQVVQKRARRPVTELRLKGSSFRDTCRTSRRARRGSASTARHRKRSSSRSRRRRVVRRLWGNARGRYRSRGRYASATVRGTRWLVEDRCEDTLVRVRRGRVVVRDLRRRRSVTVRAGGSRVVKGPARRRR